MTKANVLSMTNRFGRNYLREFANAEFLGIERLSPSCEDFFVIFKESGNIIACLVPTKESNFSKCKKIIGAKCFAMQFAQIISNIPILKINGTVLNPLHRSDVTDLQREKFCNAFKRLRMQYD